MYAALDIMPRILTDVPLAKNGGVILRLMQHWSNAFGLFRRFTKKRCRSSD
jgi:hypothetical protein